MAPKGVRLPSVDVRGAVAALRRACGLIEGRWGALAVYSLFGLVSSLFGLADALIIAALVDNLVAGGPLRVHLALVGLVVALLLVRNGYRFLDAVYGFFFQTRLSCELRSKFIGSVLEKPGRTWSKRVGELVHVETGRLTQVQTHVTDRIASLVRNAGLLAVALFLLYRFDPRLCAAMVVVGILWASVSLFFLPAFERYADEVHRTVSDSRSLFVDAVRNKELVEILRLAPVLVRRYAARLVSESEVAGRFQRFNMIEGSVTALVPTALFFATYLYGGILVLDGAITIGALIAFNMIAMRALGPVQRIVDWVMSLGTLKVAVEKTFEHLDPDYPLGEDAPARPAFRPAPLVVEDLAVSAGDRRVVEGFELVARPGDLVAISGPSGIGKTTVARCLAGFDEPDEGRIDAGGEPPVEGSIQYVPSYPLFFNATLRENLTVARDGTVGEEEIHRALSTACVDETIGELPEGLDTILEEDLRPLSKGQLQRVAIARALLLEPAILILDESLSGVEAELEDRILKRVRERHPATTVIVVSHRENVEELATTAIAMGARPDAGQTHETEVTT